MFAFPFGLTRLSPRLLAPLVAVVLAACASSPGPAPTQPQTPAQPGAQTDATSATKRSVQFQCTSGELVQLEYLGQQGDASDRAVLRYAGQTIPMRHVPGQPGRRYMAVDDVESDSSYRWSELNGTGALRVRASGASAVEVDVLTGCQPVSQARAG